MTTSNTIHFGFADQLTRRRRRRPQGEWRLRHSRSGTTDAALLRELGSDFRDAELIEDAAALERRWRVSFDSSNRRPPGSTCRST